MAVGISYREEWGLWWPDYDTQSAGVYRALMRGLASLDMLLSHCTRRGACIQAGGHVGVWPRVLAAVFERVVTFEPDKDCFEALIRNTDSVAVRAALGERDGQAYITRKNCSSETAVTSKGDPVDMVRIDSLALLALDCLCLDVEGYEANVLRGARDTISAYKPVILVEMLQGHRREIAKALKQLGYTMREERKRDSVWTVL